MRKYLISQEGQFYKANLHSHSTISDGKLTPEQMKEYYQKHGYSIIAFTDHDIFIPHQELTDENFLAINGYEISINNNYDGIVQDDEQPDIKKCHLCFLAEEPDNHTQVCWHREKYLRWNTPKYKHLVQFDENEPDFERTYSAECINEMIRIAKEHGFFVTYNHPTWGREEYHQYVAYEGMDAMEIFNFSTYVSGNIEEDAHVYEELLRAGKKIYCIAADDNHNKFEEGNLRFTSFGGFVMIKADKLEYKTVMQALKSGNFYASTGALIDELYIEDGKLVVRCPGAKRITFISSSRPAKSVFADSEDGVSYAEFKLKPYHEFFRVKVVDFNGKAAYSNAYFVEDYLSEL